MWFYMIPKASWVIKGGERSNVVFSIPPTNSERTKVVLDNYTDGISVSVVDVYDGRGRITSYDGGV